MTGDAIHQVLDYVATYLNDGIIYGTSNMVLCAHSDATYLNKPKARSKAGAYIFLSENDAIPQLNGSILIIA